MLRTKSRIFLISLFALLPLVVFAQSSGVGRIGGNTGLAKGGAGSTALVEKVGTTFDKSIFGRLSKTGSKRRTASKLNTKPANQKTTTGKPKTSVLIDSNEFPDRTALVFRPAANTSTARDVVSLLTKDSDERAALLLILRETKKAYEAEAVRYGHKNDVALAMTFFISTCVTIHNDAPEPSDESTENLYQALADSLLESDEFVRMSNAEKQVASDTLVYVSGLIIAGYTFSLQNDDQETLETYRQIADSALESLTGFSAESIEFTESGIKINN